MDAVGKAMRQRYTTIVHYSVWTLCHVVKWSAQDKDHKNYITEAIYREYRPAPGHPVVSLEWIQHTAREVTSHRRSEARDAFRGGLPKPVWLDAEEWEMIRDEQQQTLDRYRQYRDAAATRLEAVGVSHFGSGGYDTMRHEFVSIISRMNLVIFNTSCLLV